MSIEGTAQTEYASLSGKIHTFVVDKTLTISGACADAKVVGDKMEGLEKGVDEAKEAYEMAKAEITPLVNDAVDEKFENLPVLTAAEIKAICV